MRNIQVIFFKIIFITKNLVYETKSDEESSGLLKKKTKRSLDDDKYLFQNYFKLENFFEKYNYLNRNRDTKNKEKGLEEYYIKKDKIGNSRRNIIDIKLESEKEIRKEIKLSMLQEEKKKKKSNQNENDEKRQKEFNEQKKFEKIEKKRKMIEEKKIGGLDENYMGSAFSLREIQDIGPQHIKSMVDINNLEYDMEKQRIELLLSKKMKERLLKNHKPKKKPCFDLCSERSMPEWKCSLF